ncbi:unnamed protein product [Schistocephalus solidus]|uniref:Uncharacterized protein n=1 Tax=Schistocephalus solidus TaxID=70667 RepID=A0A183T5H2_SCHSO|nr:unnamed protein product [Schistocephalus solidus]
MRFLDPNGCVLLLWARPQPIGEFRKLIGWCQDVEGPGSESIKRVRRTARQHDKTAAAKTAADITNPKSRLTVNKVKREGIVEADGKILCHNSKESNESLVLFNTHSAMLFPAVTPQANVTTGCLNQNICLANRSANEVVSETTAVRKVGEGIQTEAHFQKRSPTTESFAIISSQVESYRAFARASSEEVSPSASAP